MKNKISIRGRTARKMVQFVNHLPFIGPNTSGEIRMKLSERERLWECPKHLEVEHIEMEHFKMELLRKKEKDTDGMILQIHGGGYYGRLRNVYRDAAGIYNEISNGFDVLSIDYRVAPENPFPAALEDAMDAYQWIVDHHYNPKKIFVVGDSAGGGLALALCLYLRDHKMQLPAGIVTMSAWTDLTNTGASYEENFDIDPIFGGSRDSLVYHNEYYKNVSPENPYISPVNGDYNGFPPMLMQVGEYEMLLSDTTTVAQKALSAGVLVKKHVYNGMFHVFQLGFLMYPESKEAWMEVGHFIRSLSKDKWND